MWKIYASISSGLSIVALAVSGQGGVSPMPANNTAQPAQVGAMGPSSGGGLFESNTFLEMSNRVFDPTSDSMDFQEGSYNWKGKTFNLTDQRAFRARFERFLLTSPSEAEEEYTQLMREILDQLSVSNTNTDETILDAWQRLFEAGEYDQDGGNSIIVANQVFNAWRIRKETRGTAMSQTELEDLRRYQQEIVANRERTLRQLREKQMREVSISNRQEQKSSAGSEELPSEDAFRALDLAETEARIAALEAQAASNGLQAKLQFQSQIVAFVMQRRFQHALVLSGFYQLLFKGSQQSLEVGSADIQSFLPDSDLSFTVDSISFMAREAINDVDAGVEAVLAAYSEGRMLIGLERMQETFFLGEYLSSLNRISSVQRRRFLDLYRGMLEARELAEAKDYAGVQSAVEELSRLAEDFPTSRVNASVDAAMSMSDMAVFAASQYRNVGQIDKARDELRNAIEIWPSNPSIREFQQETTKLATAGSQGERIFDDLIERADKRGIYERRMELGFALSKDEERRPVLLEVIDSVAQVDMMIAQARELDKQGESYAAWELLERARSIDSNDGPMNRARAELAPRVANYIGYVDKATQYFSMNQYASALTAYLTAQDIYPASRACRVGIDAAADALMQSLQAQANSEK